MNPLGTLESVHIREGWQGEALAMAFEPLGPDRQRIEFLFALYEQFTAPLAAEEKLTKREGRQKL